MHKNLISKRFLKHLKYFLLIIICLAATKVLYLSIVSRPYYKLSYDLKDTSYINLDYKGVLKLNEQICNPYNIGKMEPDFRVKLNNEYYPKVLPIYQSKKINFTCLNQPGPKMKTILLWNKFLGAPLFPYGEG